MKLTDYAAHDALGLAALVKNGEVTAEELLACALEAAEALNGDLNAIVRSMEAEARASIADGLPAGPLKGVPFLLKDLTQSYAGVPTDCGSRFFKGWTRDFDSEMVTRWKRRRTGHLRQDQHAGGRLQRLHRAGGQRPHP